MTHSPPYLSLPIQSNAEPFFEIILNKKNTHFLKWIYAQVAIVVFLLFIPVSTTIKSNIDTGTQGTMLCASGGKRKICIPEDYQKYDLPGTNGPTYVTVGVDIKDIPKVEDKDFSITINAYFMVKWKDTRLIVMEEDDIHSGTSKVKNIYICMCKR